MYCTAAWPVPLSSHWPSSLRQYTLARWRASAPLSPMLAHPALGPGARAAAAVATAAAEGMGDSDTEQELEVAVEFEGPAATPDGMQPSEARLFKTLSADFRNVMKAAVQTLEKKIEKCS